MNSYTTLSIRRDAVEALREMASRSHRTMAMTLELIIEREARKAGIRLARIGSGRKNNRRQAKRTAT